MQQNDEVLTEISMEDSSQSSQSMFTLSQQDGGVQVLQELEADLQTAFRWATVAFEEPRRSDHEMIQHAIQKCCSGKE